MTNLGDQIISAYDKIVNIFPKKEVIRDIDNCITLLLFNLYKTEANIMKDHLELVNKFAQEKFNSTLELQIDLSEAPEGLLKTSLKHDTDSLFETFHKFDMKIQASGNIPKITMSEGAKRLLYYIGMYAISINGNNKAGYDFLHFYDESIGKRIKEISATTKSEKDLFDKSDKDEDNFPSLEELLQEFNSLIGLSTLKEDINGLINLIKVRNMRMEKNLPVPAVSLHLVFTGNPGTGKTTVARLLAKIYQRLGVVSKGHLVEVDRSELVAGYIGQTAIKVKEVVEKSLGGILFIDEAYSLSPTNNDSDYGKEAIETLLKCMEDYRNDLVVIVAGYPNEMEMFLNSNPGLKSRFNKFMDFPDYDSDSLLDIFNKMCKDAGYILSEDAKSYASSLFTFIVSKKTKNFGNGRVVRNIFEKVISNQANRVIMKENPTAEDLSLIETPDLKQVDL